MSTRKPLHFRKHPVSFSEAMAAGLFRGAGEGVIDGDTFDLFLDLGFYQYAYERIRLAGIDTPEIYGVPAESEEYRSGQKALSFVRGFVQDRPVLVRSLEQETFGRFVADVYVRVDDPMEEIEDRLDLGGAVWCSLAELLETAGHGGDE